MTALRILQCGSATSIQDRGRFGWLRYGISSSGAADPLALAAANALVGNPAGMAAIELVFLGATIEALGGAVRLALAGAPMSLRREGRSIPHHASFVLDAGCRLVIGPAIRGVYANLAVEGGLAIADELGSKSLHRRAGLGGIGGAPLSVGQVLPLALSQPTPRVEMQLPPVQLTTGHPLRVVLGPQQDHATTAGLATFLSSNFAITSAVDRMACRLSGPAIELAQGFNIVSDGIVAGSVQIPGSGQPIVMLADRQTVGGYPKIATMITPDLRLLVQRRTGEAINFRSIPVDVAEAAAREAAAAFAHLERQVRPAARGAVDSDRLLSTNLAGHAASANDPSTWQS